MRALLVLRHAKSSRNDPAQADFDRPLNERGRAAALGVGKEMRRLGIEPDLILASPALRVVETIHGVAEGFGAMPEISWEPRIYDASAGALVAVIRAADDRAERLLLVGHNPGLQELLLRLTCEDDEGLRRSVAQKFPTGALAEVRLPARHWRDVDQEGLIVRLIAPSDLD